MAKKPTQRSIDPVIVGLKGHLGDGVTITKESRDSYKFYKLQATTDAAHMMLMSLGAWYNELLGADAMRPFTSGDMKGLVFLELTKDQANELSAI